MSWAKQPLEIPAEEQSKYPKAADTVKRSEQKRSEDSAPEEPRENEAPRTQIFF